MYPYKLRKKKGFTLIELLIVIAIILILIAIALPNFLEAQIRAKVTKIKSEFRSLETALATYFNDWNGHYPILPTMETQIYRFTNLTTPVAYIGSVDFLDPFLGRGAIPSWLGGGGSEENSYFKSYYFINYELFLPNSGMSYSPAQMRAGTFVGYCLDSFGPDRDDTMAPWMPVWYNWQKIGAAVVTPAMIHDINYSPTNGTISRGDILKYGSFVAPEIITVSK